MFESLDYSSGQLPQPAGFVLDPILVKHFILKVGVFICEDDD